MRFAREIASTIAKIRNRYDVVHYHGHCPSLPNYLPEHLNFVQTRHDHGAVCPNMLLFKTFQPDRCEDPAPGLCGKCFKEKPNRIQTWVTEKSCNAWRMESRRALSTRKSIFVSQRLLELTLKVLNAQALPKARVVHNFIDTTAIDTAAEESPQSAINTPGKVFLASAIYPPKGIGTFLKAYHEGGYQYEVEIAGNGTELAQLKTMYNLKTVDFLGWLPHEKVIERLLASKVFAVPSLCEESCSTTVLEALYLGRPVAALRRGGTPELKSYESYDGQLRIYDSMEAMADALGYIHPSPMIERNGAFEGSVKSKLQQILDVYSA
jgi:glycosyltransferase involved in cell wall biosynthesis